MPSPKAIVLITGANQGIGFATAQQLASTSNFHVLVGARSALKAQAAVKELESVAVNKSALTPITIDVTDDASIAAAAKSVSDEFGRLDILINNAGIAQAPDTNGTLREQYRQIFDVNVFGVAVVMDAFLPLLRASTYPDRRIVNVTSGQGLISRAGKKGHPSNAKAYFIPDYRSSKSAVNMITAAYSVNLEDEKIAVIAAAPGYCRTSLTDGKGAKEATDGAKVIVRAASEGDPGELSGKYIADESWSFGW
ncbi:short-chain dehydrogenase [Aspergillus heteromorphus CBS 117.55]|uniref:Short-chain dehydrogenase n=1 Tax=Aspergillus heteromorphus CBS 117.55 TaxID=1448321 RepID=A0A317W5S6_9EURO|nr:short-chain dehydrogenase [Aspergillus heteromorphus CBS 117.55]PWY80672.1 short-chain dehydrogenase [Aspergillus heteromorphus CBS 117.55]